MSGVVVVGGGIIGLSIGWRLTQRGVDVTVLDDGVDGAWNVAAGMLAPSAEAAFQPAALARLMAESARRWPAFAESLAAESLAAVSSGAVSSGAVSSATVSPAAMSSGAGPGGVGYDDAGLLSLAVTADDLAEARRGWPPSVLPPSELRRLEPALSPRVRAGVYHPTDRQVDPRRVVAALRHRLGDRVIAQRVSRLDDVEASTVVVAAGCGTAALTGLPIRPVKGQVLRLRGEPGLLRHVLEARVDGRPVYVVPRADGEIVVGATQEERSDATVTAGGVYGLLRAAIELVPDLAECELAETLVGHRPGTPDNAPMLGRLRDGVLVAAGHHRNGVLLTPVTADLIADLVTGGDPDPLLEAFAPGRFR